MTYSDSVIICTLSETQVLQIGRPKKQKIKVFRCMICLLVNKLRSLGAAHFLSLQRPRLRENTHTHTHTHTHIYMSVHSHIHIFGPFGRACHTISGVEEYSHPEEGGSKILFNVRYYSQITTALYST